MFGLKTGIQGAALCRVLRRDAQCVASLLEEAGLPDCRLFIRRIEVPDGDSDSDSYKYRYPSLATACLAFNYLVVKLSRDHQN